MAIKFFLILSVLFFIALCIDGSYSKKTPTCDCTRAAVQKCGRSGSSTARRCRNASLTKCINRKLNLFLAKKRGRKIVKKIKVSVPKRSLRRYCKTVAVQKCGSGPANKACRTQVKVEIKNRENTFRKNVLITCGCKAKYSKNLSKYNRCTRRCLRRSCKVRSKLECITQNNKSQCRKTVVKACRKVNNIKTVAKKIVVVKKRVFRRNLIEN
jgi:hypothetical protein